MFRFLGWNEAADLIERGLESTIEQKKVTYDFERLMEGATKVKTSEICQLHHSKYGRGGADDRMNLTADFADSTCNRRGSQLI